MCKLHVLVIIIVILIVILIVVVVVVVVVIACANIFFFQPSDYVCTTPRLTVLQFPRSGPVQLFLILPSFRSSRSLSYQLYN